MPIGKQGLDVHLNLNVQSGGFETYAMDLAQPARGPILQHYLRAAKAAYGLTSATFTDAHRWDTFYGDDTGIAAHTGFADAHYTRLEDTRLSQGGNGGEGIGIAFATDQPIAKKQTFDLEANNRQALGTILDIGKYGLQFAHVYLDDLDEDVRKIQGKALIGQLERGIPTAIVGDLNALPKHNWKAPLRSQVANLAVRSIALAPNAVIDRVMGMPGVGKTITEMNRREVLPLFARAGFVSADNKQQPTAPASLPVCNIDHFLHNVLAQIDGVHLIVPKGRTVSDHLGQVARIYTNS